MYGEAFNAFTNGALGLDKEETKEDKNKGSIEEGLPEIKTVSTAFMDNLIKGMELSEATIKTDVDQPKGMYTGNNPETVKTSEVKPTDTNYTNALPEVPVVKKNVIAINPTIPSEGVPPSKVPDGWLPKITGKNVLMEGQHPDVGTNAYPIMKKHGLTIVDAYRKTAGGGASKSQHLHGKALDVAWGHIPESKRAAIIQEFKDSGFTGFGVGPTSLHIDRRDAKKRASWSYYGGTATGGGRMPKYAQGVLSGTYRR